MGSRSHGHNPCDCLRSIVKSSLFVGGGHCVRRFRGLFLPANLRLHQRIYIINKVLSRLSRKVWLLKPVIHEIMFNEPENV